MADISEAVLVSRVFSDRVESLGLGSVTDASVPIQPEGIALWKAMVNVAKDARLIKFGDSPGHVRGIDDLTTLYRDFIAKGIMTEMQAHKAVISDGKALNSLANSIAATPVRRR